MLLDWVKQSGAVLGILYMRKFLFYSYFTWVLITTYSLERIYLSFICFEWTAQDHKNRFASKWGQGESCYILNYHQTSFKNAFWYKQIIKLRPSGSMIAIYNVGCTVQYWEKKKNQQGHREMGWCYPLYLVIRVLNELHVVLFFNTFLCSMLINVHIWAWNMPKALVVTY